MRRPIVVALFAVSAVVVAAADPADDRARLQGVWHSPPDAKVQVRLIAIDGKVGYTVGDVSANPPVPGSAFVGLADAKLTAAGGKTFAELEISKDYTRKVGYRFEKDGLVLGIYTAEHPLRRVNTRAADPTGKAVAGTWTITEVGAKGQTAPGKAAGLEAVSFAGDRYVLRGTGGKEVLSALYRVGPEKDGRSEFDLYVAKAEPVITALVAVKGDDLTIAQPLRPGGARPAGLDTAAGDAFVIKATRAK